MNEAEYLMKNYGVRGGCYPSRLQAEADNTLRDLYNSSYDTKAKFNNIIVLLFIQNNSQFKNIAKKMLTSIDLTMLSSPSIVHVQGCSAPQIFSKWQMSPFELSSCCSCMLLAIFSPSSYSGNKSNVCHFSSSQPKQLNLIPRSSRLTVH